MRTDVIFAGLLLLASSACREDPGTADYSEHAELRARAAGPEFLPGPNPFDPSIPRLSVGTFYEGQATETVPIDGVTTFYFVFDTVGDGSGPLTFNQETSSDRVEGTLSDRIIHAGLTFAGGGLFWYVARDLTDYSALHLSLKSSSGAFATLNINVQSGPDRPADGTDPAATFTVSASAYGYTNDGEWHDLVIPFSDLEAMGFDPSRVRSPFYFDSGGGMSGENFLIDNLYIE